MSFHNLANTQLFREAAMDWKNNGGAYTRAPRGSKEYFDYWQEHERRCKQGYSVAGTWIPGRYYFMLNFCPMSKIPDEFMMKALEEKKDKKGKISKRTAEKILDFPRFWEIHYEWANFRHIAWNGGEFMGITSPGGLHLSCAKTRGAGFSYTEAADGAYNYNFIAGSKSYYFAGAEAYLNSDGILNKVQVMLDFINANSPYWRKNRKIKNTVLHQKASYYDDLGHEQGFMSEIIGQVVDNPNKTRGKRGRKATFEEAGSFPRLKEALEIALGSMRSGDIYVGQISLFGTGGEEGPGIEGLEDVFYEPESWDMLGFPNIYEDGMEGTECGYFVPCTRANEAHMDIDGNVLLLSAIESDDRERAKKKKSKDPKALDRRKAEYPRNPSEAFNRLTFNMFPIAEIDKQIRRVKRDQGVASLIRHGSLTRGRSGVEFTPNFELTPVNEYPHKRDSDLTGCITIYESPYRNQEGRVPSWMYSLVVDPYYKEEAADLTSLFACYVIKHYNRLDPVSEGLPVASYIGRPGELYHAYEQMMLLSDYYGKAMIQSEIAGGGQGIIDWARARQKLDRLEREPEMLHNKEFYKPNKNSSLFMNMPTEKKRLGLTYLADWTKQVRGVDPTTNEPILNIHRVYDLGFLQEMRRFNPTKGNYDRISAMIIAMFMLKEKVALTEDQEDNENEETNFYARELYADAWENSSDTVPLA